VSLLTSLADKGGQQERSSGISTVMWVDGLWKKEHYGTFDRSYDTFLESIKDGGSRA